MSFSDQNPQPALTMEQFAEHLTDLAAKVKSVWGHPENAARQHPLEGPPTFAIYSDHGKPVVRLIFSTKEGEGRCDGAIESR